MSSLAWKLNRLRRMSAGELAWRLGRAGGTLLARTGIGLARTPPPPSTDLALGFSAQAGTAWINPPAETFDTTRYQAAADEILDGRFDLFALRGIELGFPPSWNRDPKTGTEAPLSFGLDIDYRDERLVGDIKYLWELNRHLELVTLAQAWHLTRDPRYADGARRLLVSWLEQCPYPLGPSWTSALELGIRLLNWSVAWQLLDRGQEAAFDDAAAEPFRRRWLDSVFRHCHFIARNLSRYSSANNHLLGELAGLFVASVSWPAWTESRRWRDAARRELESEAIKQNAEDGVNREQAFWYHHEAADMLILCLLAGEANGIAFSAGYRRRLEAMLDFIASVMDSGGHVPMVGDSDDAVMVRFSREEEFCPYRSLLATGAVLFEREDFKAKAGRLDDKSRWLLGKKGEERFDSLPPLTRVQPRRRVFDVGGYYVLGDRLDTPDEIRLVADAGPLGYLSIAAHGHADALGFTLSAGGQEILIDPGTYAYHTNSDWRSYFRGTAAHNTVRIDGMDQSTAGGNFMWLRHARARCDHWETGEERDIFEGAHDGYRRLADPVTHRRRIELDKKKRIITVVDTLDCRAEHEVELHWHLAEHCAVRAAGREVRVETDRISVTLACPPGLDLPRVVSGLEDPPLGWVSRRFDEKTPCPTIVCAGTVRGTTELLTTITIEIPPSAVE